MSAEPTDAPDTYWNHDSHYHPWIVRQVPEGAERAIDVGCGEGLLLERLAPHVAHVVGLEPDPASSGRAERRAQRCREQGYDVQVQPIGFEAFTDPGPVDLVTFVASIHQTDVVASLDRVKELLRPGGRLVIVGVSWHRSLADRARYALTLPLVRLGARRHGKTPDVGVKIVKSDRTFAELAEIYRRELPGHSVRRGLYFRYLLTWTKPAA